jgi:gas vesicle protein
MWFKLLAGATISGAIIAWLTFSLYQENSTKQNVMKTQIKKESLKFEEKMDMFNANMLGAVDNKKTGDFFLKKSQEAKQKLENMKKQEEEEKRKLKEAEARLQKQLSQMDKETSDINWDERKMDKDVSKGFDLNDI